MRLNSQSGSLNVVVQVQSLVFPSWLFSTGNFEIFELFQLALSAIIYVTFLLNTVEVFTLD